MPARGETRHPRRRLGVDQTTVARRLRTLPGPIDESVYEGPADSGSTFRISDCQYIYNIKSHALGAGKYLAEISINSAVVGQAVFELK